MKEHSSSQPTEKHEWLTQIEAVLEILNEGVVITSQENRVLFVNSRFVEMSGIPSQELLGAAASEFYSAPSRLADFIGVLVCSRNKPDSCCRSSICVR